MENVKKFDDIANHTVMPHSKFLSNHGCGEALSIAKDVKFEIIDNIDDIHDLILYTLEKQACICWVKNTIEEAQHAYQALIDKKWIDESQVSLLHSRFTETDRQQIESDIVKNFGVNSGNEERRSRVVITTQMICRNLNIDFDFLISDISPVEILMPRISIFQKHTRDEYGNPLFHATAEDLRNKSSQVYLFHDEEQYAKNENQTQEDQLKDPTWLTYYALKDQQQSNLQNSLGDCIFLPQDIYILMDSVYGEISEKESLPIDYDMNLHDLPKESLTFDSSQTYNYTAYQKVQSMLHDSLWMPRAGYQLPNDVMTVALAKESYDGQLEPFANAKQYAWALSMVSIPSEHWFSLQELLGGSYYEKRYMKKIQELKSSEPELAWVDVLPIELLTALNLNHTELQVSYDCNLGWYVKHL